MARRVKIGDKAKEFSLKDQHGKNFSLSQFTGKRVVLSFHPLAWTSVCAEQMKSLEKGGKDLELVDAIAVGISVDSVPSKKAWAEHLGLKTTRLLSDFWPHGRVAQLYGILRDNDGFSERANIVIDATQKIAFMKIYPLSELPDLNEIIEEIRQLK